MPNTFDLGSPEPDRGDEKKKRKSIFGRKSKEEPVQEPLQHYPWDDEPVSGAQEPEPQSARPERPPRQRPRNDAADGKRRPYDELSMPIKVRNRSGSDPMPGPGRAAPVKRDEQPRAPGGFGSGAAAGAAGAGAAYALAKDKDEPASGQDDDWRGGTWVDSGYSASDEEAHRNVVYEPPNFLIQTLIVMFAQMKLYSKGKATYILIGMIALIPILTLLIPDYIDTIATSFGADVSNAYIGLLLSFLPLIMALFTAKQCGTQIPNEFKQRTAYMSIPLPMHRLSFYFGKYLAGFLYCLALFLLAFGVAVACTSMKFDSFYCDVLLEAFVSTVVAILVYSSLAFCVGCFISRGSVLLPLFLNLVAFPSLFMYIGVKFNSSLALMMPSFLPDAIVQSLGFPVSASLSGFSYALVLMGGTGLELGSMWSMCAIGLVWSIGFLALGAYWMTRRET